MRATLSWMDGLKVVKSSRAPTSLGVIVWGLRIRTHTNRTGPSPGRGLHRHHRLIAAHLAALPVTAMESDAEMRGATVA